MDKVEKIRRAAEKRGYKVTASHAATGSDYLTCELGAITLTIRVANHSECYPPSRGSRQISFAPGEATYRDILDALDAPETVEKYREPEMTEEEIRWAREAAAKAAAWKASWKEFQATLTWQEIIEWKYSAMNRPVARALAAKRGCGVSKLYAALTNGRRF